MKTLALPLVVLLGAAAPVSAQTYANVEANSGWSGSEHAGTVIDAHVGYKKDNWYVQAGPSRVSYNSDSDIEFSGKAGASFEKTIENLGGALTDVVLHLSNATPTGHGHMPGRP